MSAATWRAAPDEAADVTRLMLAFRDWIGDERPNDREAAESIARLIDDADTEFLLGAVRQGDAPCGVCQLRYRHSFWTSTPDCWLEDLYVEDAARGHGVGRALVVAAVERARARGARRIELDTNEDNAPAIALYESLGFSARSKSHEHLRGRDVFMGRAV